MWRTVIFYIGVGIATLYAIIIRSSVNYYLLRLHSNHAGILSIISTLPGFMFIESFMLDKYAKQEWEKSLC